MTALEYCNVNGATGDPVFYCGRSERGALLKDPCARCPLYGVVFSLLERFAQAAERDDDDKLATKMRELEN